MDMTPQRWSNTRDYLAQVFGNVDGDEQLATLRDRALAAGLPDIAISHDVGALLKVLSLMATQGAASTGVIIEVGTLAGCSGIWLARGLPPGGRLITIEYEPRHAAFASGEFKRAGLNVRAEVGAALDVLPRLAKELGPASIDLAFLDAVKPEYERYFELLRPMIRRGGLLIADNALGARWWIDDPPGSDPARDAVDRFNRRTAADADFDASCVPIREGVMIARRK
jgi:caffeoyl-CoA O-methyltransferase